MVAKAPAQLQDCYTSRISPRQWLPLLKLYWLIPSTCYLNQLLCPEPKLTSCLSLPGFLKVMFLFYILKLNFYGTLADAHQEWEKPADSIRFVLLSYRIRAGLLISQPVTNLDLKHSELINKWIGVSFMRHTTCINSTPCNHLSFSAPLETPMADNSCTALCNPLYRWSFMIKPSSSLAPSVLQMQSEWRLRRSHPPWQR